MKKLILKISAIWLVYSFIFVCFIYRIQGESIILMPLDIKYMFAVNRYTLYAIICTLLAGALFCFYAVINEREIIRFRWDIRIVRLHIKIGALKPFYSNINRIMFVGICAAALIVIALIFGNAGKGTPYVSWTSYPISHAGGGIDGNDYTNSLDALEYNYALGHRVFEMDFQLTSDNKLVCRHDWRKTLQEGVDKDHIPTEEVFKSIPILGKYTPLTLEDLLLLMKEYEDIYIVTDTKSTSEAVVFEQFNVFMDAVRETGTEDVLDRFIIQIYKDNMLDWVKSIYDFPTIIYTLYASGWDGTETDFLNFCRFCKLHNIKYLTMWDSLATPQVLEIANSYGIEVFVHTVNDEEQAQSLIQDGVKGVYTDYLIPDMFSGRE